jgi:hypothetical protein
VSPPLVEIPADDALLRRVANVPDMVKRIGGLVRPSSVVFKPHPEDGAVSVDVRRLLPVPGNPLSVLAGFPEHGLVELLASTVRQLGLEVSHVPLPQNPAHANIEGLPDLTKAERKRSQRELALAAAWVRQPGVTT